MVLEKELGVIQQLERLKTVTRQNQTLDGRFENAAEHSWQLTVMALIFKDYFSENLNMQRVLSMLLLHDVGEIGVGDTSIFDEEGKAISYVRELASVTAIFENLSRDKAKIFLELWQEFERGDSPEARFARCLDALAPLMNHLWSGSENHNPDDLTYSQVRSKKAFIENESPQLWQLTLELLEQSVQKGLYRDDRMEMYGH